LKLRGKRELLSPQPAKGASRVHREPISRQGAIAVLLGQGHEGKVYEFGGDYAWDYEELAKAISEILHKPVAYRSVDPQTLVRILKDAGRDEGAAGFTAALDSNIAAGLLAEVTGQLSALIGRPTTPLKKGLTDALLLS
jgi:NAD(P)H dehydrogenase (quinone)